MNNIGIKAASFYIPEKKIAVSDLTEYQTFKDNNKYLLAFRGTGINYVHIEYDQNSVDLAIKASKKIFIEYDINRNDIDCIIYLQGRSPTYLMSSDLTKITKELGLDNVFGFTLTDLGCVDISAALIIAKNLILCNKYKNILICYGSKPVSQKRFRYPVTIIGDGGMALVVSVHDKNKIIDNELSMNGKYWDLYSADYKNEPYLDWHETCKDIDKYCFELAVESKNRFEDMNKKILQRNNFSYSQIKGFIMQNISLGAFRFYEDVFLIKFVQPCYNNLVEYGHLGSIDIILNYFSLLRSNQYCPGDKVLIMNNSPIAAWSTFLMEV